MILKFQCIKYLLIGWMVVAAFVVNAQTGPEIISVSGTVSKRDGNPLPGAILWFGPNSYEGTCTDQKGHFHFDLIPSNALLWCRFVGMKNSCSQPNGSRPMNIVMDYDTLRIGAVTVSLKELLAFRQKYGKEDPNQPLFLLDGVQISKREFDSLDYKGVESFKVLKDLQAIELYGEKGKNGVIKMFSRSAKDQKRLTEQTEHVFSDGLVMPAFPGGDLALRDFVKRELSYPAAALNEKIQGKVFVTFRISLIGKVENVRIGRGVHPMLDQEAVRIVSSLPDWEPGYLYGKPWTTSYTIPIRFSLPDSIANRSDTVNLKSVAPVPIQRISISSSERRQRWKELQEKGEKEIVDDFSSHHEFPGGEEGLRRYFLTEIRKSHVALNQCGQGTFLVSFAVNGRGKVEREKILFGLHPILDEEVLRIISTMPPWKPGNQRGRYIVDTVYTLPVCLVKN